SRRACQPPVSTVGSTAQVNRRVNRGVYRRVNPLRSVTRLRVRSLAGARRRTRAVFAEKAARPGAGPRRLQEPPESRCERTMRVSAEQDQPDFKPLTWLPLVTEHLQGMLQASREQLDLLGPALTEPYKLDDATVDRLKEAFQTQLADLWLWQEQVRQW